MRLIGIVCLVTLFSFQSASAEHIQNHRKIEYEDISKMVDFARNKARSPFISFESTVVVIDKSIELSDIKLWLTSKDAIVKEISIEKDGAMDLPIINQSDVKDTWLNVNQAKDTISMSMSFKFNIGNKTEVAYYDLFILLDDFNDFMGEMAGMASWMIPDMDTLKFVFKKPATIEIVSKKKTYQYNTNADNEISIDVRRKLYKENPLVKFSIAPISMFPED